MQAARACGQAAARAADTGEAKDMLPAGQGSYGTVYKASVRNTDQVVAVKILPLGQQNEQATIQKEIDMLKECEHPNIVRYMVGPSWPALSPTLCCCSACQICRHGVLPRSAQCSKQRARLCELERWMPQSQAKHHGFTTHLCRAAGPRQTPCGSSWSTAGAAA